MAPRARKAGDTNTNARKRYYRAAERNLAKAAKSSGATAARYRALARQYFESALDTYDPNNTQRYSQPIQHLANEFGIDLSARRTIDENDVEKRRTQQRQAIGNSIFAREKDLADPEIRAEREARTLLKNKEIARRIIGGTVDIWHEKATIIDENGFEHIDKFKIFPALFEYFRVETLPNLLAKIEKMLGSVLWKFGETGEEFYDTVKLMIDRAILRLEAV